MLSKDIPLRSPDELWGEVPVHFVLADGQLLHGTDAYNSFLASGEPPEAAPQLGCLIVDREIAIDRGAYGRLDTGGFEVDDLVRWGKWLSSLLPAESNRKALNRDDILRSYYLAVGPSITRLVSPDAFGSLGQFYSSIELQNTHRIGLHDNLTNGELEAYIARRARNHRGKPTYRYLNEHASHKPDDPSGRVINRISPRKLSTLHEERGFVDARKMDFNDLINWGVKFKIANQGATIYKAYLGHFSALRRGPGYRAIYNKVGPVPFYDKLVSEAYDAHILAHEADLEALMARVNEGLSTGNLPEQYFVDGMTDEDKLALAARFWIVSYFTDDVPPGEKHHVARLSSTKGFIKALTTYLPTLSKGNVELAAIELGVYELLWPFNEFMKYLKLPEEIRNPDAEARSLRDKRFQTEK